jgi:hypothetical protein
MSAVLPSTSAAAPPRAVAAAGFLPVAGILTLFWVYVAVSNVVYAHTMSINLARVTAEMVFAPWQVRVLQHALMYPLLLGAAWLSLRAGWRPARRAVPLQVLLGVMFAAMGQPALIISEAVNGEDVMGSHVQPQTGHLQFTAADQAIWLGSATGFLLTWGFGLALVNGFRLYRRYRDGELRIAALEREWSAARLSALRMQLSPHTLFNLLNTIRGHIEWDPPAAQAMVVQFADLLRRLLNAGEREFSTLADELAYADLYLELQRRRFADRIVLRLPSRQALPAAWVPSLILQPLIENAVVHGLAGHQGSVEIRVDAQVTGERLALRVVNTTAPGRPAGPEGIGLRNVRERLALQFGSAAQFRAGPGPDAAWSSEVLIPLVADGPRPAAAPAGRAQQ